MSLGGGADGMGCVGGGKSSSVGVVGRGCGVVGEASVSGDVGSSAGVVHVGEDGGV